MSAATPPPAQAAAPISVAAPQARGDTRTMSVLLPAGFTLEPATGALVAEVFELVVG